MLINRDELARKVLEGEITSLDDLNSVLRSMIKDVVETAMGAEMTGFLSYDRYQTPDSDPGNRRKDISGFEELILSMYAKGVNGSLKVTHLWFVSASWN